MTGVTIGVAVEPPVLSAGVVGVALGAADGDPFVVAATPAAVLEADADAEDDTKGNARKESASVTTAVAVDETTFDRRLRHSSFSVENFIAALV
ncbi:MAG TPA: hypothetical protein V6C86_14405 [Oculatellaceae cyanobacterium]